MSIYEKQRILIKQEILDKAIELFETKGYEETSVTEITNGVGIAKGTFYNYFDSKKDILFIWALSVLQKLDVAKALSSSNSVKENMYAFIEVISDTIIQNEKLYLVFLKEIQTAEINEKYEDAFDFKNLYLRILKTSNDFDLICGKSLDMKISVLNNSLFMGIIDYFNSQSDSKRLECYLKEIVDICLYGIYAR